MADRDGPVATATASAIHRVLGKEAAIVCSPGTYDQKHVDRIGRLKECIAYGPGVLELAHQPDEWVSIADMRNAAKVMALAALDLLCRGE
jgi:succinyl-diaminopimelate desuccinylase